MGIPSGIGPALGADETTCVTICGDAGSVMADHAIETAARHEIPIVVVMNDSALGTEYHRLERYTDRADVSVIETPSLAAVASAMGADGCTIRSTGELLELEDELGHKPAGPVVLDRIANRNVVHRSKT